MQNKLERQLGAFLRKKRGSLTYAQFARKLGLPQSTVHRLEMAGQSVTLRRLQQIMDRLRVRLGEIFPDEYRR